LILQRHPDVAVVAFVGTRDQAAASELASAGVSARIDEGAPASSVDETLRGLTAAAPGAEDQATGSAIDSLRTRYEAAISRSAELEHANARLAATVARLEKLDRMKDEFLAMVSHELRNPLTVVLGMAQTLAARPAFAASSEGNETLGRIVTHGRRLKDMVERLLETSALSAGRAAVPDLAPVRIAELVESVVADRRLAEGGQVIELHLPPAPTPIVTDAEAVHRILCNVIDNACKHTPPGTLVDVQVEQAPGRTRIAVADRGPGVDPEDRERVFEAFTQLDGSSARQVGGVGLGLFLVDQMVATLGGSVWVEGNPGGGARFVIELPENARVAPTRSARRRSGQPVLGSGDEAPAPGLRAVPARTTAT
jgi:signal transduction histidine kinase